MAPSDRCFILTCRLAYAATVATIDEVTEEESGRENRDAQRRR